jgi:hypothetical protein
LCIAFGIFSSRSDISLKMRREKVSKHVGGLKEEPGVGILIGGRGSWIFEAVSCV